MSEPTGTIMGSAGPTLGGLADANETNSIARGVLGVVASYLREGFELLNTVQEPGLLGIISGVNTAKNYGDIPAARGKLTAVNQLATELFGELPDDDIPVEGEKAARLSQIVGACQAALENVDRILETSTLAADFLGSIGRAVSYGTGIVGDVVESVAKAAGKAAQGAIWESLKAIAPVLVAVVVVLLIFKKPLVAIFRGALR